MIKSNITTTHYPTTTLDPYEASTVLLLPFKLGIAAWDPNRNQPQYAKLNTKKQEGSNTSETLSTFFDDGRDIVKDSPRIQLLFLAFCWSFWWFCCWWCAAVVSWAEGVCRREPAVTWAVF
ncbi:hypothetical protein E2C01_006967 [Portunus trituberculatus]|uniref:Uncharacterized protein n=1 Tax=Portunus trituberculatus TaxID=210409 RepID=A0A5B7CWK3_PORTR|nr:hypothetical protein [Portunus trituberculatus]